ncbi:hypothetical protein [Moraxella oblonga]|uniref:hypothetical protein n=1 Tax=Moraxella oblonga TaxID=200413 RepID=UPI000831BFAF|nr:hypothetical protein [Moraxella oblonga]
MANIVSVENNSDLIIELHKKSLEKFKSLPKNCQQSHCYELVYIYNNLANLYTLNFDYRLASRYYDDALSELYDCYLNKDNLSIDSNQLDECQYRINLNKIYLYLLMDDKKKAKISLETARQCKNCDMLDIAHMYALMGESRKCYDLCKYENYIDTSFSWIWSAICNVDPDFLYSQIDGDKKQAQEIILDYQQELECCNDEKRKLKIQEHIDYHTNRLEGLDIWKYHISIPSTSLEMECRSNLHYFYKCYLFGCESCGNLIEDNFML